MNTKGKIDYSKMDLKRFYLPGLVGEEQCPHCKHKFEVEFDSHYPYAVKSDGTCSVSFLCPNCEESIDKTMVLEITLKEKKS